ncbi:hypothetical protein [Thermaerobacter subterraneus]|uniref:Uncharacterized protein n=1 Tax=Thermaerobacter subterraneus DSM 13965 TaxID=867903 RepID=K6P3G6_9FIRM|nr:hypothetical protein [Thermaerobacter subterraneus]EKP95585.1 hypothetical protein ThesuDRAFT_01339 [Thermaerobacter subterraneus DSM 13965]
MRIRPGQVVCHPELPLRGLVLAVRTNPACLMPVVVVRWENGVVEELDALRWGPLEDAPDEEDPHGG